MGTIIRHGPTIEDLLEWAAELWVAQNPTLAADLLWADGATSSNAFLPLAESAVLRVVYR